MNLKETGCWSSDPKSGPNVALNSSWEAFLALKVALNFLEPFGLVRESGPKSDPKVALNFFDARMGEGDLKW